MATSLSTRAARPAARTSRTTTFWSSAAAGQREHHEQRLPHLLRHEHGRELDRCEHRNRLFRRRQHSRQREQTNNGLLNFDEASTAGRATITNNDGITFFSGVSSGGTARLIANGMGVVDFFPLLSGGTTVGSLEGSGNFFLGSKTITVGGNGLSTEVSGVIQDGGICCGTGGALVKEGAGTLTLSGINTYTGPTTVDAGALVVNGSIATSSGLTVDAGALVGGVGILPSTTINGRCRPATRSARSR
ncbi:MAG TPA: autotransporter-associated beta strand repeat-containing protein [Rhodoplanes sp.]|nr:autotransporter-associated beta strand repeat-containing protein [Rhodoplanes sp.]